jgi:hypothetical protein
MIWSARHLRRLIGHPLKEPLEVLPRGALLQLVRHSHTSSQKRPLTLLDGNELMERDFPTTMSYTPWQLGGENHAGLRRQSPEHPCVR